MMRRRGRAVSSVGRTLRSQCRGRGFESPTVHHFPFPPTARGLMPALRRDRPSSHPPMTFVVDCMLGKAAKWLKILGFDTLFFPFAEDSALLEIALGEGRTLLTRDHALAARARSRGAACLLIESEVWEEQVRQVLARFDLSGAALPFIRCVECNVPLSPLSRENAANFVAAFVLERGRDFSLCPSCGRVFWRGTHRADMEAKIAALLI